PLLGLAFVFTRTTQRAITTSNYANEVNFTYMDASDGRLLEALEGYLASIVLPGLANLTDWGGQLSASAPGGSTSGKAKIDEYLNALQRLLESLAGARASMQNQILLSDPPDELAQRVQSPVDLQLAVHSSEALEKLERLLLHWAKEIEQVLNESEQVRRETDDVGPTAELTFWKGRMARFNNLMEQMARPEVRKVVAMLHNAKSRTLRVWHTLDARITDAANEARDNVKYLYTLDKFFGPLTKSNPVKMREHLPALINAIRMVHTVSRYYNTSERMTSLFVKVTNQMIFACKTHVRCGSDGGSLWDQPRDQLIERMRHCLDLNADYQAAFRRVRDQLHQTPQERQFDFSENYIFGKFDTFCRRLVKITDSLQVVQSLRSLLDMRTEGIEHLIEGYKGLGEIFRRRKYDPLDHRDASFDADYDEFKQSVGQLIASLTPMWMKSSGGPCRCHSSWRFERIEGVQFDWSEKHARILHTYAKELDTVRQLYQRNKDDPPVGRNLPPIAGKIAWSRHLLEKVEKPMMVFKHQKKAILQLPEAKKVVRDYNRTAEVLLAFEVLYHQQWLARVKQFHASLNSPLLTKDPVTGSLSVNLDSAVTELLREAAYMQRLGLSVPDQIVRLMFCEMGIRETYRELDETLREFDKVCADIPAPIQPLMKPFKEQIGDTLEPGLGQLTWVSSKTKEYIESVRSEIANFRIVAKQLSDMIQCRVESPLEEMSLTALIDLPDDEPVTADEFVAMTESTCSDAAAYLTKQSHLVEAAVDNVVQTILESLPEGKKIQPDPSQAWDCLGDQAVAAASSTTAGGSSGSGKRQRCQECLHCLVFSFLSYYTNRNTEALVRCTRLSLDSLRRRANRSARSGHPPGGAAAGDETRRRVAAVSANPSNNELSTVTATPGPVSGVGAGGSSGVSTVATTSSGPLFKADVVLQLPRIVAQPTLDEMQQRVNKAIRTALKMAADIPQWRHLALTQRQQQRKLQEESAKAEGRDVDKMTPEELEELKLPAGSAIKPLHRIIADHKDVAKVASQLGSLIGGGRSAEERGTFKEFYRFQGLWIEEINVRVKEYMDTQPTLSDMAAVFKDLFETEAEIINLPQSYQVGPVLYCTERLKTALAEECRAWRLAYGKALNDRCGRAMGEVLEWFENLKKLLARPVQDLDDVRAHMAALSEVREGEVRIDLTIGPIEETYALLSKYEIFFNDGNAERVDSLTYERSNLKEQSRGVQDHLLDIQPKFRDDLLAGVGSFRRDLAAFVADYDSNLSITLSIQFRGPKEPEISPEEASDRLALFQGRFNDLWRKYETYTGGEELFGLPESDYPELQRIRKDLSLLQKLYGLYNQVLDTLSSWKDITWSEVNIENIRRQLEAFHDRCHHLPKALRTWQAYVDLSKIIDDFGEVIPLLEMMSSGAMMSRHWERLEALMDLRFDVESESFLLRSLMEAPLLEKKDDIEEICLSAVKEKEIEGKLRQVISDWSAIIFQFASFKTRGELLLKADSAGELIAVTEDSLMALGSLLSNRYNAPFRLKIQEWMSKLSTTSEIIDSWQQVQNLWIYLEAVFVGGDIAKQLPGEAKRFSNIDKSWQRVMQRAHEITNVVQCCTADDTLSQLLPHLLEQLELCRKSLTGYLEKKRLLFPRFFFVSDPALLEILGQASDSHAIQAHLSNIFGCLKYATFDDKMYDRIVAVSSREADAMQLETPVMAQGNVEAWLGELLRSCRASVHASICSAFRGVKAAGFRTLDLLSAAPAQAGHVALQLLWTSQSEEAVTQAKSDRKIMQQTSDRFQAILTDLIGATTSQDLPKLQRARAEALVTLQLHLRDSFEELLRAQVRHISEFEWQRRIRFYLRNESRGHCTISITDVDLPYMNEFLGCPERLVATPLTERCSIAMAQALGMALGAMLAGPTGAGKTETAKDVGRTLGRYVVLLNCSDQIDYRALGRIVKGLAQSGSWGCLDEFNRMDPSVMSVAAQQVSLALACKKERRQQFVFTDGDTVELNAEFAVFITTSPGYPGRLELPENLKTSFRPVAMVTPDATAVLRVRLTAAGYQLQAAGQLARKTVALLRACDDQLSHRPQYDFGMRTAVAAGRALVAARRELLTTAQKQPPVQTSARFDSLSFNRRPSLSASGYHQLQQLQQQQQQDSEQSVAVRALRDALLPRLDESDEPQLLSLLEDLFPGCGPGPDRRPAAPDVEAAVARQVEPGPDASSSLDAQVRSALRDAVEQIWDHDGYRAKDRSSLAPTGSPSRHGVILLGESGSGKTSCGAVLLRALAERPAPRAAPESQSPWRRRPSRATLFGKLDAASNDWRDGVFSALWRRIRRAKREQQQQHQQQAAWLVLDGPIDAVWVESLNSVLDDNRLLTLANGDRISMALGCRVLFEVDSIQNATPSTVSRNGLVHFGPGVLDWQPVLAAWLAQLQDWQRAPVKAIFEAGFPGGLGFVMQNLRTKITNNQAKEHVRYKSDLVIQLPKEFTNRPLLPPTTFNGGEDASTATAATIFDFYVDSVSGEWLHWSQLLPGRPRPATASSTSEEALPVARPVTHSDAVRMDYLIRTAARGGGVLLVGGPGVGKTTAARAYGAAACDPESHLFRHVAFSSASTPSAFQRSVESYVDKRMGTTFGPPAGKRLTMFIDDIGMPDRDAWGDQPTSEALRQLMESGGFYNLKKPGEFTTIVDVHFLAAMAHPGAGRGDIPARLKRQFRIFNCCLPSPASLDKIYGSLAAGHFSVERGFTEDVCAVAERLVAATRRLWQRARIKLAPTPARFHCQFTMRDLGRVWQGMMNAAPKTATSPAALIALWRHECARSMSDRLPEPADRDWLERMARLTAEEECGAAAAVAAGGDAGLFVHFLPNGDAPGSEARSSATPAEIWEAVKGVSLYQQARSDDQLTGRLSDCLAAYNKAAKEAADPVGMPSLGNMVLFDEAVAHLARVSRIIRTPSGHALLLGPPGCGRRSLTRLAAFAAGQTVRRPDPSCRYSQASLIEDLRQLHRTAGLQNSGVTFLLTEADLSSDDEGPLETINSLLAVGEVPGLFSRDELEEMLGELVPAMKRDFPRRQPTNENLLDYYSNRLSRNLHLVLCLSPQEPLLPSSSLPGTALGCTVDWYRPWPRPALISVSRHFLASRRVEFGDDLEDSVVAAMAQFQVAAAEVADEQLRKCGRRGDATTQAFLGFAAAFADVYSSRRDELDLRASRMDTGLRKLLDAAGSVGGLARDLSAKEAALVDISRVADEALKELTETASTMQEIREQVDVVRERAQSLVEAMDVDREIAEEKLEAAKPALEEAETALQTLKPADISTVKKLAKPPHLIMRIMDCVLLLFRRHIDPVTMDPEKNCIKPSWSEALKLLSGDFLGALLNFPKDTINGETAELLQPYFEMEDYTMETARKVSGNVAGLCAWTQAMATFYSINKDVMPLKLTNSIGSVRRRVVILDNPQVAMSFARAEEVDDEEEAQKSLRANLAIQEGRLSRTRRELRHAQLTMAEREAELEAAQERYDTAVAQKQTLTAEVEFCRKKVHNATALIEGLSAERIRWTEASKGLETLRHRLLGDTLLATAFVAYGGPLTTEFRELAVRAWKKELMLDKIIFTDEPSALVSALVDPTSQDEWRLLGLPGDDSSAQSALVVSRQAAAGRWPLLVDPHGLGRTWLRSCLEQRHRGPVTITAPSLRGFRAALEEAATAGRPIIVEDVGGGRLHPLLAGLLATAAALVGRIRIGEKLVDVADGFQLYLTCRQAAPAHPADVHALTAVVDFGVTPGGLEERLLDTVAEAEKPEQEAERAKLLAEAGQQRRRLEQLEEGLLRRLSDTDGALVDDASLVEVLREAKQASEEARERLSAATEGEARLCRAREDLRPVASRGRLLYSLVADLALLSPMYSQSLDLFLRHYRASLAEAAKSPIALRRIANLIDSLTRRVYRATSRGLYAADRAAYSLLLALRLQTASGHVRPDELDVLLRAGADVDASEVGVKPQRRWLSDAVWLNAHALSRLAHFSLIVDQLTNNERAWRAWYEEETPELADPPDGYARLGAFHRLLLVRCLAPERTPAMAARYVSETLGPSFADESADTSGSGGGGGLEALAEEAGQRRAPLLCLLAPGCGDPVTDGVERLARRQGVPCSVVALGRCEQQQQQQQHPTHSQQHPTHSQQQQQPSNTLGEVLARRLLHSAITEGRWLVLQNLHLCSAAFLDELSDTLAAWSAAAAAASAASGNSGGGVGGSGAGTGGASSTSAPMSGETSAAAAASAAATAAGGDVVIATAAAALASAAAAVSSGTGGSAGGGGGGVDGQLEGGVVSGGGIGGFRCWLTSEPLQASAAAGFPAALIGGSLKFTADQPASVRAGLARTFAQIGAEQLESNGTPQWRPMLFCAAFLHAAVNARLRFGAVGWSAEPRLSPTDLGAALQALQNHLDEVDARRGVAWPAVRHMIGEVAFGGRFLDDWDRRLLSVYCRLWLTESLLTDSFQFARGYRLPRCRNVDEFRAFVEALPAIDTPETFGLHANADVGCQRVRANAILESVCLMQHYPPSQRLSGLADRRSIADISEDVLGKLPDEFGPTEIRDRLRKLDHQQRPLNVFLRTELNRMHRLLTAARADLAALAASSEDVIEAAELVDLPDTLLDVLEALRELRVPTRWLRLAWEEESPSESVESPGGLAVWLTDLRERHAQLRSWLVEGRPPAAHWLAGYFRPAAFLVALRQEAVRARRGWSLETVHLASDVTRLSKEEAHAAPPDGAFVHGLVLDGAGWDRRNSRLTEAAPKAGPVQLPLVHLFAVCSSGGGGAGGAGGGSGAGSTGLYECPVYTRSERGQKRQLCCLQLRSQRDPEHWTLRGVAAVLGDAAK
uniref:DHC_N1 domain-containing protein n=2 Tax=Macrostomum lignano TaxID=282301 RepID=A0A1I8HIQ5_9PLAT